MSKKDLNDSNRSCLNDLYPDLQSVTDKNPTIQVFGRKFNAEDIQRAIREQPMIDIQVKNSLLDIDTISKSMDKFKNAFKHIPKLIETVVMESICIETMPGVDFFGSEMKTIKGKKRLMPPRMTIDLSQFTEIKPFHGVRINTGYVLRMPVMCMGLTVEKDKVVNTKVQKQIDAIIIPTIVSQHDGIIQSLYARDPDDTGLLTINFTTTSSFDLSKMPNKTLQIVFEAYRTIPPMSSISVVEMGNEESGGAGAGAVNGMRFKEIELFKTKDSRIGRLVKNPKIKYNANKFDMTTINKSLLLDIPNSKMDKIKIDNMITLFTSRKREWCNKNVVTYAGIYNPDRYEEALSSSSSSSSDDNGCAEALVSICSQSSNANATANNHGMTFLKGKIVLFSRVGKINSGENLRYINGSFHNIDEYDLINKSCRQLTEGLNKLSFGMRSIAVIRDKKPEYNERDLLKILDYHRILNTDKIDELLNKTDLELFNCRPSDNPTYSSSIYKAMKILVLIFCGKDFTIDQYNELSVCCGISSKKLMALSPPLSPSSSSSATAAPVTAPPLMSEKSLKSSVKPLLSTPIVTTTTTTTPEEVTPPPSPLSQTAIPPPPLPPLSLSQPEVGPLSSSLSSSSSSSSSSLALEVAAESTRNLKRQLENDVHITADDNHHNDTVDSNDDVADTKTTTMMKPDLSANTAIANEAKRPKMDI